MSEMHNEIASDNELASDPATNPGANHQPSMPAPEANEEADNTEASANPHANQPNDTRFRQFMNDVRKLARDGQRGADSLPKLGIMLVRASKDGILDFETKRPKGESAVKDVYMDYRATQIELKGLGTPQGADSIASQVSKLKGFADLGRQTKVDGEEEMDRIVARRKAIVASDVKARPVYDSYVRAVRATNQMVEKEGRALTDEEIDAQLVPDAKEARTVQDVMEHVSRLLEALVSGEGKGTMAGLKCQDDDVITAQEHVSKWLANQALFTQMRELDERLAERGLKVVVQGINA